MLSTTVMATTAPVLIAPAMNTNMYLNPITQDNMAKLKKFGYHFIAPDSGHLACGIDGVGRLPEPDTIVDYIELLACRNDLLKGKKVIVTLVARGNLSTRSASSAIIPAAAWALPSPSCRHGRC
mgnify:CR=1 FL=1